MYGEYLKHLTSFIVATTEALYIPSSLAFDRLHNDVFFSCMKLVLVVIKHCNHKVNANTL